jgi:pectinesterase
MKYLKFITIVLFVLAGPVKSFAQYNLYLTVALDGTGDYTSIQEAVDATKSFPDKRITIYIKNGIYHEKVKVPAWNTSLSIIGENVEKTIISWNDYFDKIDRGRNSTFFTYTFKVEANDFHARNLTVRNSAGDVGQAVALHVTGDRNVFINCRILGHQDALYAAGQNSRQYFDSCFIEGTTDFIFGAATALFDNCTINSLSNSYITAASTPEGKPFGYVFRNCKLTAAPGVDNVYLGRPWRDYARVVFLDCKMGRHIMPQGWSNWSHTNRDKTAYFAEYNSTGPGANPSLRIEWSHQLAKEQAATYTLENILRPALPEEPEPEVWIGSNR